MMTKEQFVKTMSMIQNFMSEQETLKVLIDKLTDGGSIVTFGDNLICQLIELTEDDLDYHDILDWWLWEDVDKVIYDSTNNYEISVRTPEELYDFIISSKKG